MTGPKNGKKWDSRKRAVIGTPINDNTSYYGVVAFESAGKAAEFIIENDLSKSKVKTTVSSSITSALKGRENRDLTKVRIRTEAYGFRWEYK